MLSVPEVLARYGIGIYHVGVEAGNPWLHNSDGQVGQCRADEGSGDERLESKGARFGWGEGGEHGMLKMLS